MSTHIYGYFEDIKDGFKVTTIKEWERKTTIHSVKKYLKNHLLSSLEDDFIVVHSVLKKKNVGYFVLPKVIFPYISFLGSLCYGKNSSESAIKFMVKYMGRVSKEYEYCAGVYYLGYRHGLLHTNMPKIFSYGKRRLGWHVSYAKATSVNRRDQLSTNKTFYPKLFYEDLQKAIQLYIDDFDNPKTREPLFANFKKGFIEMSKIHHIKDIPAGKEVKKYLRKGLNRYSR